jgi:outer membrane protein assembly factor BamB
MNPGSERKPVRWWPAALILLLAAGRIAWVWMAPSVQRQGQVESTAMAILLALALLFLWLLFLSRLRLRLRLLSALLCAVLGVLVWQTITLRAVSGDLVPIFGWRWSGPADARLQAAPADGIAVTGPAAAPQMAPAGTADFPQFRGPQRDGIVHGVRLARDWAARPPREVWRIPVGAGWSGFAVASGIAVTQEQRGKSEQVTAYDLATGGMIWSQADESEFRHAVAGDGPRATPAIAEGRVFTLGATGVLNGFDLKTGERLWGRNIILDAGAGLPQYGTASSPLVLERMVIVSAGGPGGKSLLAYERDTGELIWSGGDNRAGYSSPVYALLAGALQILIFNDGGLVAHDPMDGRVLWETGWPAETQKVSQPLPLPRDRVYLSSGYGIGGRLFEVARGGGGGLTVRTVWESRGLKAKFTNVVHRDGYLYGLDDGVLVCLDLENGERRWKGGRYGHGQVLLAGDLLIVQAEDGAVVLVAAEPGRHREHGRLDALQGKTWNHPALAGSYLLVRNDSEAACYELPLEEEHR